MRNNYIRIQVLIPKATIPYLERFMRERGYEYCSHAIRRIVVEYLSKHYGVGVDTLLSGGSSGH